MHGIPARSIWSINIPNDCDREWRKILNLSIWGHLMHRIGNGKKAYLWKDNWHPSGPLVENSGMRIIQQSSLPTNAEVSDLICDGDFKWHATRSDYDKHTSCSMSYCLSFCWHCCCVPLNLSPDEKFGCKSPREQARMKNSRVQWFKLISSTSHTQI